VGYPHMLNEMQARNAAPAEKPYKLHDERGLCLYVSTTGAKSWRFKYKLRGREYLITLGLYPDVGLKRAREKRNRLRDQLPEGKDPREGAEASDRGTTFEHMAGEYFKAHAGRVSDGTIHTERSRLERLIYPTLGKRPIGSISPKDLLDALRPLEARAALELAHRVRALCGRVFRFSVARAVCDNDPSAVLRGAIAPPAVQHMPAITDPVKVGQSLRAIDGYVGAPSATYALKLLPLVFVRPGELRQAHWSEFDLDNAEWRIPAERMKMREQHIVPLARQVVALLRALHLITGDSPFVFPSVRSNQRCISDNTINAGLRRLGYSGDEIVGHGFRSMASTLLNEQGWHTDLIELQLAHAERKKVRAAYNRAQRLEERRNMMQAWADYLDGLRQGATVIPIRRSAALNTPSFCLERSAPCLHRGTPCASRSGTSCCTYHLRIPDVTPARIRGADFRS